MREGCDCILCQIEEKAERDSIGFFSGPAMMEPDIRILTNKTGFCPRHYQRMLETDEKLGVALVLQTRVDEVMSSLENAPAVKKKRFSAASHREGVACELDEKFGHCAVCDRVEAQMRGCIDNFVYLLKTEPDFKEMYLKSEGLCMKHFMAVMKLLEDGELFENMLSLQKKTLAALKAEIDRFVLKFDYRNADMSWENARSAPERAVKRLRGII